MEYSNRMKAKHSDWEEVDDLETRGVVAEAFFGIAVELCRRITHIRHGKTRRNQECQTNKAGMVITGRKTT